MSADYHPLDRAAGVPILLGPIIGGLIVSQLLTLYTTPIIYLYLDRLRARRREPAPLAQPQTA